MSPIVISGGEFGIMRMGSDIAALNAVATATGVFTLSTNERVED